MDTHTLSQARNSVKSRNFLAFFLHHVITGQFMRWAPGKFFLISIVTATAIIHPVEAGICRKIARYFAKPVLNPATQFTEIDAGITVRPLANDTWDLLKTSELLRNKDAQIFPRFLRNIDLPEVYSPGAGAFQQDLDVHARGNGYRFLVSYLSDSHMSPRRGYISLDNFTGLSKSAELTIYFDPQASTATIHGALQPVLQHLKSIGVKRVFIQFSSDNARALEIARSLNFSVHAVPARVQTDPLTGRRRAIPEPISASLELRP